LLPGAVKKPPRSITELATAAQRDPGAVSKDVWKLVDLGLVRVIETSNPGYGMKMVVTAVAAHIRLDINPRSVGHQKPLPPEGDRSMHCARRLRLIPVLARNQIDAAASCTSSFTPSQAKTMAQPASALLMTTLR
jgi:hypothetical protein